LILRFHLIKTKLFIDFVQAVSSIRYKWLRKRQL